MWKEVSITHTEDSHFDPPTLTPSCTSCSTLLGAITGSVRIDDGEALVASKVKVGYLKQTAVSGSTKTVKDEAASEMAEINSAKEWMNQLEQRIAEGDSSEKTLNELAAAQERFANAGGWTQDQDVDLVLKGLGFQPSDSDRLCSDFSGGWKMRIALAKLLLSQPDLLMLDEPSNHLVRFSGFACLVCLYLLPLLICPLSLYLYRTLVHEIGWLHIYPTIKDLYC
jgi:ABC-type dipeptide/oligopeptide/nickel transport system ATPase subunit